MSYCLKFVKNDIKEAKEIILGSDNYGKDMKPLGLGHSGATILGYRNAAIKRERMNPDDGECTWHGHSLTTSQIDKYMELSKIGMERGYHFIPYLDCIKKDLNTFSFMPKITGATIKSADGLKSLLEIGTRGLKVFFNDYVGLHEIGFVADNNELADNYLVGFKNIFMFDMNVTQSPEQNKEKLVTQAMHEVFNCWHYSMDDDKKRMFKEHVGNIRDALKLVGHNTEALNKLSNIVTY